MPPVISPDRRAPSNEVAGSSPTRSVADQIRELARENGVVYERTALDDYADTVSRLSDAEVTHDDVEDLLLALYRAGVIDADQNARLHYAYVTERRR